MRAWEFMNIEIDGHSPLKDIHYAKQKVKAQKREQDHHNDFVSVMYANHEWHNGRMENERLSLELKKLKGEMEALTAASIEKDKEAVEKMAQTQAKTRQKDMDKVSKMARSYGRRLKK